MEIKNYTHILREIQNSPCLVRYNRSRSYGVAAVMHMQICCSRKDNFFLAGDSWSCVSIGTVHLCVVVK